MSKMMFYAAAFSMMAGAVQAQTANGSPGAPAAGGGTSTTGPSGGKPFVVPTMTKSVLAAQAAKTKRDKADEKRLEHDMKICIGC